MEAAWCLTSLAWYGLLSGPLSEGIQLPQALITWADDFHACWGPGLELEVGRKENWQEIRGMKEDKGGKLGVYLLVCSQGSFDLEHVTAQKNFTLLFPNSSQGSPMDLQSLPFPACAGKASNQVLKCFLRNEHWQIWISQVVWKDLLCSPWL